MSKISNLYWPGDIKYYRNLHKTRQLVAHQPYVSYQQFRHRLDSGWSLKEAIYRPQERTKVRKNAHIRDTSRDDIRKAYLIGNDIRNRWERLDHVFEKAEEPTKEDKKMLYDEFFPKPTFRNRFKNLFKRA